MSFPMGSVSEWALSGIEAALPCAERRKPEEIRGRAVQGGGRKGWRTGFMFARRSWRVSRALHRIEADERQ